MVKAVQVPPETIDDIDIQHHGYLFHYFRAEVYRETNWRIRLDTTTNWAIVVTAAILSYNFSTPGSSHVVILLNYFGILFFLHVESRRFRYYNILKYRVRLIEQYLIAEILEKKQPIGSIGWRSKVASSLRVPRVSMSRLESIAWRIRRNYIFLIVIIVSVWVGKLLNSPPKPNTFSAFINQAAIGAIPGYLIFTAVVLLTVFLISIAFIIPRRSELDDLP